MPLLLTAYLLGLVAQNNRLSCLISYECYTSHTKAPTAVNIYCAAATSTIAIQKDA